MKKLLSLFKRKNEPLHSEVKSSEALLEQSVLAEKKPIELLLDDKIEAIKTLFEYRKIDNWLDTSITFIKLERNGIICFPYSGVEYFENVTVENKAVSIKDKFQKIIYHQKIVDILYPLEDESDEFDETKFGCLLLENGYVLEENRMAPSGTGGADMFCKTLLDFEKEMIGKQIEMYSVKTKQKYSF